jgi:hypothetical protein
MGFLFSREDIHTDKYCKFDSGPCQVCTGKFLRGNMKRQTHKTALGKYYTGDAQQLLESEFGQKLQGKVDLILTSPPFPLNKKKSYGNFEGEKYKEWLISMAKTFSHLITNRGSIVMEMGNAWVPERPVQSLLHLETLIGFVKTRRPTFCQQFICTTSGCQALPVGDRSESVPQTAIRMVDGRFPRLITESPPGLTVA